MKKNKNASQEAMPKKDYQQEFDPDVKKDSKGKKVVIGISAFIAAFFLILLVWYISDNSVKEEQYEVEGQTAAAVLQQGEEVTGEVVVEDSLFDLTKETVDVTVPLAYYQGKEPADTLDKNQLASGYVSVKKDGTNVVFTIKTSFYASVVENLYEYYDTIANDYEKKNGVQLVSSNRAGNLFTITVEKPGYKANAHRDMLKALYYNAAIYQCYLGVAEPTVDFQMKYLHEQYPFTNYPFPSSLGKDLTVTTTKATTTSAESTQAQ